MNTIVELGTIAKFVFGALGIGFIVGFVAGAWCFIKNEEMLRRRQQQDERRG